MHFAEKETAAQKIEWPIQIQLGASGSVRRRNQSTSPKGNALPKRIEPRRNRSKVSMYLYSFFV